VSRQFIGEAIEFERQARSGRERKVRWWLHTLTANQEG